METKANIVGEVSVEFSIRIGWNEAERLIVNDEVDEHKLRAYLLTKALGCDYPVLRAGNSELSSLDSYIADKEADNDYAFIGCNGFGPDGNDYVFGISLCYNYADTAEPVEQLTGGDIVVQMCEKAENFLLAFDGVDNDISYFGDVDCATIEINGVEREFCYGNDIWNHFEEFVAECKEKTNKDKDNVER